MIFLRNNLIIKVFQEEGQNRKSKSAKLKNQRNETNGKGSNSDLIEGNASAKNGKNNKKTKGRVKIKMEFIENKIRRYTTFSKRKTGIMKKVNHSLKKFNQDSCIRSLKI